MSSDSPAAILFDELGNPIGVLFDGTVYRLQTQGTIVDSSGNGPVAVKPPLTAATPSDPALVVSISPNTPVAASTDGKATSIAPTYIDGTFNPLSLTLSGDLRVDGSSHTQPISGTVTANQGTPGFLTNAWPELLTDGVNGPVAVKPANAAPVATDPSLVVSISPNSSISTNADGFVTTVTPTYPNDTFQSLSLTTAGALRIDGSNTTQPISGTVTANAGTGSFTVAQSIASNLNATVVGTITANIGTTNGLALDTSVNGILVTQGSTTLGERGPLIQGAVTSSAPSYTTAQTSPLSLTTSGSLRVDGSGSIQPISGTITTNQGTTPWIDDVTDRPTRLLGVIYGSQGHQLLQTPTNFNTQVELAVGSTLIDPRAIRSLTTTDTVTVVQPLGSNLHVDVDNFPATQVVSGTVAVTQNTSPWIIQEEPSTTTNITSVAASTSNVTLLASNSNRKGATIWNDSTTATLYVKLGTTASTTSYTTQIFPAGYYEIPYFYTGEIDGIWSANIGSARVSELS